jgi:glucose/arabinose dehydrogenase
MRALGKLLAVLTAVVTIGWSVGASAQSSAPLLELKQGDHICIIGNTLAERLQHDGWLETYLHAKFPEHGLVIRNLGYAGDEINGFRDPNVRMRSMSFGSQDEWLTGSAPCPQPQKLSPRDQGKVRENRFELTNTKADVILAFYGYGESWAGEAGLPAFKQNVEAFIKHTLAQKYNGKSAPKLVLISSIPFEKLADVNLPGQAHVDAVNARLALYSQAMGEVAKANNVPFVDLFSLLKAKGPSAQPLTINGIHITEEGGKQVGAVVVGTLLGGLATSPHEAALNKAVREKNFFWFNRYRVTDGYSTYGDRAFLKFGEGTAGYGEGLSNYSVGQRELDVLDVLTSNRDAVVWSVAKGKPVADDDKNLPEFIPVITNKPGTLPNGEHLFLTGEEAISKMTVHSQMQVNLFADEAMFPELVNPVQMAFDPKGRLWVATWPTYPHWQPTKPMNDSLLILEDTNGDGKADVCKTFAGDLHNPTGFEFWNGGVFVAQGPDLLFLKDTNGDDKYDVKQRVAHGVDTADTHHTINSFVIDPGGALYMQEGTFHHSQVETAWGPTRRLANGGLFRYEPRAQKFDVYVSFGFANPHGHVFDRWGQDIVWDGTGSQPYHAVLFSGDLDYPNKHARPPQVYQQRTRPCSGTEVLSSSHFPEELRGNLLVLNVIGFQGILNYKVEDNESSFKAVEQEAMLSSTDPNFRPGDIEVGADGAVYFVDWQNPIIGHMQHNLRDPSRDKTHGRVYRVTAKGRDLVKPVAIAGQPIPALLAALKSPDDRVRHRARLELSARPTADVIAAAKSWLAGLDRADAEFEHHRLEGLWLSQAHNVVDLPLLKEVLASPDFRARAAAIRVLVAWRDRVPEVLDLLQAGVNDEQGRVRLIALWGLSFFHGEAAVKASEIAVESLVHPQDPFHKLVLEETTKTLDARMKK